MPVQSYSDTIAVGLKITDFVQQSAFWLNQTGYILAANDQLLQKLGYPTAAFTPNTIFELAPDLSSAEWQYQIELLQQNENITFSAQFITQDDKKIAGIIQCCLFRVEGKSFILGWVNFGKSSKAQSQRQQELFKISYQATNHAQLMIFLLNADGYFQDTNEVLEQKLGYQEEALKTMHISNFFSEPVRTAFAKSWQNLLAGSALHGEALVKSRNGHSFPIEYYISPMGADGSNGYCGIWTDISERKKKEAELQRAFDEIKQLKENLERENQVLQEEIKLEYNFNNILSSSAAYKKVLKQVEQVANTDATVLIYGEPGTGKELLARTIHQLSKRAEHSLVKVQCSAVPPNILEAELFGYEKGAFPGAFQQKKGRLEIVHQGTLFLDEVAELSPELQSKLLRVLQQGTFERMGGNETLQVDVRILAATSRNMDRLVREGAFRQDLYYRLHVFPIYNLPLRERREDIPLLLRHFVEKYAYKLGKPINSIPQKALDWLMEYDFPGNVRELENIIERAVILSTNNVLYWEAPLLESSPADNEINTSEGIFKTMEQMQRDYILQALRQSKGLISGENGAAKLLGMNDKTLYSKMKKLKIERQHYLDEDKRNG